MESTAIDLDVLPTINWFICDFQCNFKQQLADHIKSDHNELISKQAPIQKAQNPAPTRAPAPKPVPVQLYKCPRCERQVRNAAQLTAHTMAKHRKFPHQCLICAKVSRSWKMGKLHIEKAHRNAEINPEDIKTLLKLVPENFKHVVNPTIVETPVQPTNPVPVTAPAPPAQQPTPTPTVAPTPAPIPQAPLVMPMHKCNECGARTRTAEALENHVKTHPPAQPCPK